MSSEGRSRRTPSRNNAKKFEVLERLKALNRSGAKNKCLEVEEESVYDEVDEESYAKLVSQRQREDWIVDDDGAGYAEHGREIFDDESDDGDEPGDRSGKPKHHSKNKYQLNRVKDEPGNAKKDIRSMFNSMKKNLDRKPMMSPVATLAAPRCRKSLNEVTIDDNEIESLVDSITANSASLNEELTPLKLHKTPRARTQNPFSASKRKSLDQVLEQPPAKRRSLVEIPGEFDFDEIIGSDSRLAKPIVKTEPIDEFDDDYMLPDNTALDQQDLDSETSKIKTEPVEDLNLKIERFPEEEWMVSNATEPEPSNRQVAQILPQELAFETDQEENKLIKFYWLDAFHDPMNHRQSDCVLLFGKIYVEKVKKHVSCCLQVKNLERRIFILPRQYFLDDKARRVQIEDVYREFAEEIAPKLKIKQFRSRKVIKKYSFDLDFVPSESEYLEVLYPATCPAVPNNLFQGNSYRYIFGTTTSMLENLILDLNLMGPGWLKLKNPEISETPISWCKIELTITKPLQQISLLPSSEPSPDFTIMSLCFKTFVHTDTKTTEIVAISCLVNREFNFDTSNLTKDSSNKFGQHFCMITKIGGKNGHELPYDFNSKMALKDYQKTKIDVTSNERELITFFMAKFQQIDPDIIVGHDIYQFDYDILLQRFNHYRIPLQWSKLGRLKCSGLPGNRSKDKQLLAGRLVCDVKILARELIMKAKSFDLTELAAQLLKKGRFEVDQNLLPNYYTDSPKLFRLIEFLMKDNDLILSIAYELNCLQLCKQITNIAGNLLSRTLLGGRSERNEYLLLHAFHRRGYIVPDKKTYQSYKVQKTIIKEEEVVDEEEPDEKTNKNQSSKKTSYTGGLVLQPKIGYYDKFILLMDFNSLYPSIIQEYNICFTTIPKSESEDAVPSLPESSNQSEGILPIEIRKLVESRREVKRKLLEPDLPSEQRGQLDIKQKALKITANSMYGCLGFDRSRFYAKHLAALVTQKGREILLNTKELVEKLSYEVIYGDTDSIMILTNCHKYEEVREIGHRIQSEVNRLYKLLEIDIDGVFRCMLLLKKKKYAALSVSRGPNQNLIYQREVKGLDIIRRDWSVVAKMAGEAILDRILSPDEATEVIIDKIHQYLKQLNEKIRAGELALENYVINKALTKRPEEYGDQGKSLTHVQVALRYNSKNLGKKLGPGDTVPFVICIDGTQNSATQRGYHLEEVRNDPEKLSVDIEYYLSQQILPVVSRLCDPLDGTDSGIIAEFLGLESRRPNRNQLHEQSASVDPALTLGGQHKFDCCKSLLIRCPYDQCGKAMEIQDVFRLWNQKNGPKIMKLKEIPPEVLMELTLAKCEHCQNQFHQRFEFYFELELRRQIQKHVNKFYQKWMICDDSGCAHRTQYISGWVKQNNVVCPKCRNGNLHPEVSEHLIYQQLTYFYHIFDLEKALQRFNSTELPDEIRARKNELKQKYGLFYQRLQNVVQYFLDQSSYNEFDLGSLFRKFRYSTNSQISSRN